MNILIVGGTSSISKYLIPKLEQIGTVTTAGRKDCDIFIDLSDVTSKITLPSNIDLIIHTAAYFGGSSLDEIQTALLVNVIGTLRLCEASHRSGAKHFLLISSIFSHLEISSAFYNIYSISKKHGEEVAKFYCRDKSMPLTVLRPSRIYGNESFFANHHPFFYSIIDRAQKGETITIYGSNDAKRNFIHINDLSEIILRCIEEKVVGEFDCSHPHNISYSEIAASAISAFKSKSKIQFLEDMPNIDDNIFKFNDTFYELLNHYPKISIQDGMVKIAKYRN